MGNIYKGAVDMKKITNRKVESYNEFLVSEEKSKNTVSKYMRDVCAFTKWLSERELTKAVVLEYKEHLRESLSARSTNSVLSSLNSFFEFCHCYELKLKMIKIQKQIFANADRELSVEEYDRLLACAKSKGNEKLYLLMQTICTTGIRVSELQFITVESLKLGRADIEMKGKARIILIPKAICHRLSKYAKEQGIRKGSIFLSKTGKALDRSNIWKMLKGLCQDAGVDKKKVFPHNFRHLFAKTFYSLHKDIVRLADILGHSSVNTTRIYTMETGEIHRKQIEVLKLSRC